MMNKNNKAIRFLKIASCLGLFALSQPFAFGQEPKVESQKPKANNWALGARISHLYDLKFTAYDLLNNGFAGEDLSGLNGNKTKFDIGLGLDVVYFWTPVISIDASFDFGKMTGANEVDYYNSNVNFLSLGANFDLKTKYRKEPYKWVPYVRASIGRGAYDTERKFIVDDGTFQKESGSKLTTGLGAGLRYHFNDNLHLVLQSEFIVVATDAWDGYNYGSGKDHMIKSTLGIRYTFGKNPHTDRGLAWQGGNGGKNYDKELAALQDSLLTERRKVAQAYRDIASINEKLSIDTDGDGVPDIKDHCPDVAAKTKDGCPEEIQNIQAPSSSVNNKPISNKPTMETVDKTDMTFTIYFDINSSELEKDDKLILQNAVKFLKENPEILASVVGYADNSGSDKTNYDLSLKRAQIVNSYLVKEGIDKERLQVVAFGKQPKQDLDQLNRKVEIVIE
jgi:OmpA-OmpF porin, OOP family